MMAEQAVSNNVANFSPGVFRSRNSVETDGAQMHSKVQIKMFGIGND